MATYTFQAYEVDAGYYNSLSGSILSSTLIQFDDTDSFLQANPTDDPNGDQTLSIGGGPFSSAYDVEYLDFAQVNNAGPQFEVFAFMSDVGPSTRYYIFSKDVGFAPNVGDDIDVVSYSSFVATDYSQIGSAICFGSGTWIDTPAGLRQVETLKAGDWVTTEDQGPRRIVWVGGRQISQCDMLCYPELWPVRIPPRGGSGLPPLVVSQLHGLHAGDFFAGCGPGIDSLIRAKHLAHDGISGAQIVRTTAQVHYFHILLETHALVRANGYRAETLRLGPVALEILCEANLREIARAVPGVTPRRGEPLDVPPMAPVLPNLNRKQAQALCAAQNDADYSAAMPRAFRMSRR